MMGVNCVCLILLLVNIFVCCNAAEPHYCRTQADFEQNCTSKFSSWLGDAFFWNVTCRADGEGQFVHDCMKYQRDNCEIYDEPLDQQFNEQFSPFSFVFRAACEYYLNNEECTAVATCYENVNNFTGEGLNRFYEYFCGSDYMAGVFTCLANKNTSCPGTVLWYSNRFVINTVTRVITQADLQMTTSNHCSKLLNSDVTCIATRENDLGTCNLPPVIDVPNGIISCGNTAATSSCLSEICGSTVANFYTFMFSYMECVFIDVGECLSNLDECDMNANCTNTDLGYSCSCKAGYEGDGFSCADVDECLSNFDECDMNANCTNTDLGYSCSCKAGYEGDGFSCTDINECTSGQSQCDINAQCRNTEGSYYCECNTDYTGDGLTCTVNPNWNNWGEWETCSVTCGRGSRKRSRTCKGSDETNTCTGDGIENQDCLEVECPVLLCSKLTDSYGTWPETKVGLSTTLPCLYSYQQGAITKKCGDGGRWGEVQDKCYVNDTYLEDLNEQIDELLDLTNGTGDPTGVVTSVIDALGDITEDAENFQETSNIIEYTLKITKSVNTVYQDSDTAVTDDTSEDLIGVLSNIIDPDFENQWINENDVKGSDLIETLDEHLKTSTEQKCNELNVNQIIDVDKEHIYTEIGKKTTGIKFPNTALRQGSGIELSPETLSNLGLSTVCYNGARYSTLLDFVEKDVSMNGTVESFSEKMELNSDILSVQLAYQGNVENLDPPIRVTLDVKDTTFSKPICVYWDFEITNDGRNGAWSDKGCNVTSYTRTHVVCSCTHLTNFAILMSPSPVSAAHTKILSIISAVGCVISMICLVLTIIVHCLVWRLVRSDRAIILMNLCVALLLALGIFLVGVNRTESREACVVIAALIQLLFLAVFFFMLLIGLEILICVVHVFMTKFRIKILLPLAWFLPVLIVGISLGVTKTKGYGNAEFCWLDTESGLIWAFIGPAAFVILVNFIIILVVFKKMASSHVVKSKSTKVKVQTGLRSICVLVPVMGLTWVMGILSVNSDLVAFQYLFSIFNTLQGFFVFLFHCVFNRQIRDALKHRNKRRKSLQTFSSDLRKNGRNSAIDDRRVSDKTLSNDSRRELAGGARRGSYQTEEWDKYERKQYHRDLRHHSH